MGFLFSNNPYPTVSGSSTTSAPAWLQSWLSGGLQKADTALNEPYQAYTGPRVAGTTADQTAAYNLTRANTGAFQPMIDQGNNYLTQSGQAVGQSDINQYMNPYDDAVTDRIAALGQRNLTENLLPNVNATFLSAGQGIGSSRNADFTLRALRDANESILGQQASTLQSGFNTALGAAQQQKTNELNAGTQLGNLASTGQSVGLKDAAALQAIGQEQQGQTQKSYDQAYSDFEEQKNYPLDQAKTALGLIQGLPTSTTTGTTTTTGAGQAGNFQPSSLAQLAGAGVGLAGLLGLSKGGAVNGYAKGGKVSLASGKPRGRPKAVTKSEAHFMPLVKSVHRSPTNDNLLSLAAVSSMPPKGRRTAMPSASSRPGLSALRAA